MCAAPPDLVVIIVNWNTRQLLLDCLACISAAVAGLTAEVWVVDNGSTDGSLEAVSTQYPDVCVIANQVNLGFAAANNQAIRASCSRYMLLLNSDTLPTAGSLTMLVRFLDTHAQVGIVGPRLRNEDGSVQLSYASFPSLSSELTGRNLRRHSRFAASDGSIAFSVDWIGGACFAIKREAAEQFGLLDERYFMYTEEADWCYRARQAGWEVCYLPKAEVVHLGGQSSRMASTRMKAELYRSKLRFFRKHYNQIHAYLLGFGFLSIFLAKAVLGALVTAVPGRQRQGRAMTRDSGLMLAAVERHLHQPLAPEVVR